MDCRFVMYKGEWYVGVSYEDKDYYNIRPPMRGDVVECYNASDRRYYPLILGDYVDTFIRSRKERYMTMLFTFTNAPEVRVLANSRCPTTWYAVPQKHLLLLSACHVYRGFKVIMYFRIKGDVGQLVAYAARDGVSYGLMSPFDPNPRRYRPSNRVVEDLRKEFHHSLDEVVRRHHHAYGKSWGTDSGGKAPLINAGMGGDACRRVSED